MTNDFTFEEFLKELNEGKIFKFEDPSGTAYVRKRWDSYYLKTYYTKHIFEADLKIIFNSNKLEVI